LHLAHPLEVKMFTYRRVANDERDAGDLADLLRMGRSPESWIAPPEIWRLRELVRYRHELVGIRTSCKDQTRRAVRVRNLRADGRCVRRGRRRHARSAALPGPYTGLHRCL
jgi:hypothetical protein